ncbi:MAG: hypothetical protein NTZ34_02885, partial [Chloroflexi bacterium]|nr:hypothetical protein [Chloroflexota bacterium]
MFKDKALVIVTILVLVLSVVAMSCAPAAKPATTTPPTTTTPAATTPPASTATPQAPPATTTTPAAAPEVKTSYEATTYTNDKYGFSIKYPKSWITIDAGAYVFAAAADQGQTSDTLFILVVPAAADLSKAAKSNMEANPLMKKFDATAEIKSS